MPELIVVGGPNGAGKSTFGSEFQAETGRTFINPDEIFRAEFKNPDPSYFPYYLKLKLEELFESRESIIYESNLHNKEAYQVLEMAVEHRYRKQLLFISTDSIDLLKERVKDRVLLGLHNVDPLIIEKRYKDGLSLLPKMLDSFDQVKFFNIGTSGTGYEMEIKGSYGRGLSGFMLDEIIPRWLENVRNSHKELGELRDRGMRM